jgi:transcriptional regulator with XRE-family HTH domain
MPRTPEEPDDRKERERRGINPKRAHFNAGTAKNSSGASFAQFLRAWLYTQNLYATQAEFAAALGVSLETVQWWLTARSFPGDPFCDKLYSITQLDCFSPTGRIAARREHEQKRGLSHSAILKRETRLRLTPKEFDECSADPERAFTIRGDDWLACLECGLLLKQIRSEGSAAHLKEHKMSTAQYRIGPDPAHPRYGPNRGLICNALAAKKAERVAGTGNLRPDAGLANLRRPPKGRKMPPEFSRKQSARMRTQRKPEWSKPIADIDVMWPWLIEGKSLEEIAEIVAKLSPDGKFTSGGVWTRIKAIIGVPVRRLTAVRDLPSAEEAVKLVLDSGADVEKLKASVARLCEESRNEVATKTKDRKARQILLSIPRVRVWLSRNLSRVKLSPSDLARVFVAAELKVKVSNRPSRKKTKAGHPKGMSEERVKEAENLLRIIAEHGGKRGAIRIAAKIVYRDVSADLAYDRARQTLSDYKKHNSRNREKN